MNVCEWRSLRSALAHFVTFRGSTQSQRHIKPLHWYVACRLVVEGGFDLDEIVPRPPFRVTRKGKRLVLVHDPGIGGGGERKLSVTARISTLPIRPSFAATCSSCAPTARRRWDRISASPTRVLPETDPRGR